MTISQSEYIYIIDKSDAIIFVNDNWLIFAEENNAPFLNRKSVLGRTLWEFIADSETSHLHELLLKKVRKTEQFLQFSFRCDSPHMRRFMSMKISLLSNESVEYRCQLLDSQVRIPPLLLREDISRTTEVLRLCGWCNKLNVSEKNWVEIEDGIEELQLFEKSALPHLNHTMCDDCLQRLYPIK